MATALVAVVNTGVNSTTIPAAAKSKTETVKVGNKFKEGNLQYKVTSLKGKTGTAMLIGASSKKLTSVNVPETVKTNKYTLTVTEIGANAFKNCKKLENVTTNTKIKKIGKNAFSGCKNLAEIDIKSKNLKSVGKNALKGISKKAVVNVPEGKNTSYEKLLKVSVEAPKTASEAKEETTSETRPETVPDSKTESKTENVPTSGNESKTEAKAETEAESKTEVRPETEAAPKAETTPKKKKTPAETAPETEKQPETEKPAVCGAKHLGLKVVESVAPTCTEPGLSSYKYCTVCGYRTEPIVIQAPGHDLVQHAEVPATCTSNGMTAYETCRRCSYATTPQTIAKLAHSYGNWSVVKEASCRQEPRKDPVKIAAKKKPAQLR